MKKRPKSIAQQQKQRRQEKATAPPAHQPVQPQASTSARVASARPIIPPVLASKAEMALLLDVPQVCHLLNISRATLYRLEQAGKIPGRVQLMGQVRYHRPTLEAWLIAQVKPSGGGNEKL
jgi:predicted DNA-binding transcriptional regulator AlpA